MKYTIDPGFYFGAVDHCILPNMNEPLMENALMNSYTQTYFKQPYYFNREEMTITQMNTGIVHKIFDWNITGITFEKFKI